MSNDQPGWGPSHQTGRKTPWWTLVAFVALISIPFRDTVVILIAAFVLKLLWYAVRARRNRRAAGVRLGDVGDPLPAVLAEHARHGGGVYLGVDPKGGWVAGRPERATLILGPPRSGKSSSVIFPAVLAHAGPVVSTSTKPDVLAATGASRSRLGNVWQFDPTGSGRTNAVATLRWSPVTAARTWDGALLIARAMVTGARVGAGTTAESHWSKRAAALLAPLLHAAAVGGQGIDAVVSWVSRHELNEPGVLLTDADAELACGLLVGLQNTEARERSSIFSAAADALDAYTSQAALSAAREPNFDAEQFVRSRDTIYIHAPAENQALAAPLVCGLLSEIRAATYRAHHVEALQGRVLFALDEVANIAPLAELPAIASEGGGQGLCLLAALQDLSQARVRWGDAAEGFLTLFGSKLILPGVADPKTLEAVSLALGEYDRQVISTSRGRAGGQSPHATSSRTYSTQRQRVLPPGDVANIPHGQALYLDGLAWQLLSLTPAHATEPWRTLTAGGRAPAGNAGSAAVSGRRGPGVQAGAGRGV